jgi:hypothetical protein
VARPYVPPQREYAGVLVWVRCGEHNVLGLRTHAATYRLDFTQAGGCAHDLVARAGRPAELLAEGGPNA